MKSKRFLKLVALGLLSFPMVFCSCEDEMTDDPHYKPQVRTGSAYQQLKNAGNYSIFLEGVDLAGFTSIMDGKALMTVMAPDDEAFKQYLEREGYASIKAMYDEDPQLVTRLIGFHMLYYAYDWKKMVNFDPQNGDGVVEDELNRLDGLYFKQRTYSSQPMTLEYNSVLDENVKVYHFDRLLPIFSSKMFETMGVDAKANYEYFYPNSTWRGSRGSEGGFNIANAAVLDSTNVITDNGYLYHIDQVLDPVESLYMTLKKNPKYSRYITLYDTYSTYVENATLSTDFGGGDKVYLHQHDGTMTLPNIACEWYNSDYKKYAENSRYGYNIFAPSNEAIDKLFQSYWKEGCGYDSFEELDPLILQMFIMQTFANKVDGAYLRAPIFPERIKKYGVYSTYETPILVDPDKVEDRYVCSNGFLYGMDEMQVPAIFSSVVAPAFNDAAYRNHLYALSTSGLIVSLASDAMDFVAMIPDTAKYAEANMPIQKSGNGYVIKEWDDVNGVYGDMSASTAQGIVNMHVAPNISELPTEQGQVAVIETNTPFNYWFVKDGEITTNVLFNQQLSPEYTGNPFVKFTPLYEGSNGQAYSYEGKELFRAGTGDGLERTLSICNDVNYPYYLFSQLLQKSGLAVEGTMPTIIAPDSRFIAFVPTNEAIKKSIADIPGASGLKIADDYRVSGSLNNTNKSKLAAYLRSYFISSILTPFAKYPYPGAGVQGEFVTFGDNTLKVVDNGEILQVNFADGENATPVNVVGDYGYLPFAYQDGCFHFIEDVLK